MSNSEKLMLIIILVCVFFSALLNFVPVKEKIQSDGTVENVKVHSGFLKKSKYELIESNQPWTEANNFAENYRPEKGSHLATITSKREWKKVKKILDDEFGSETGYVWLGGSSDESRQYHWVTGEEWKFSDWYKDSQEPSFTDSDGTPEEYLCAWNVGGEWSWNDQRDDLASKLNDPDGKMAMLIEYKDWFCS